MFKRIAYMVSILCLLAGTLSVTACDAASGKATPSKAKDSVVMVYGEGDGQRWWGTGFAIGEPGKPIQFIATNAHCVLNDDGTNATMTVYFSAAANKMMSAEVYWKDAKKDLAILRLPEKTTEREAMVFCPSRKIDIDDSFSALGYPWTANIGNDFSKFDKSDIAITKGGIQKQTRIDGEEVYLLDLSINQGNSGGPLVNSKGQVVGINTFSYQDEDTKQDLAAYAVAIDELMYNVDRRLIPITVVGEITTQMIIYIAIGVIVLILLTAFVIILVTKKKKNVPAPAAPIVQEIQPSVPVSTPQTTNANVKAYIKGITGSFAGRSFEIGSKLIIGRDSNKCTVAFPLDTAGVSGVHCEVTFDGSTAYVRDLGSSYGTFLANGTKLAAKTPARLSVDDRFYLASEENTFEFRM